MNFYVFLYFTRLNDIIDFQIIIQGNLVCVLSRACMKFKYKINYYATLVAALYYTYIVHYIGRFWLFS